MSSITSDTAVTVELPLSARASVPSSVVYRTFGAETVILNLETGTYHGLNPTGGRMLELLERCETLGDAAAQFAADFGKEPAEVEDDVRAFCARLLERRLIEVSSDGAD